jgi:succinate dehydrogenase / fumarate reductase flavoprotein subunit
MQGLADGYFILPYTIGNYFAGLKPQKMTTDRAEFRDAETEVTTRLRRLLEMKGKRTADSFHRELGHLMWEGCGMARTVDGLKKNLQEIPALREEYWKNVSIPGKNEELNMALEKAMRVADFFELAELMCHDALERNESCGGHFREEYQTPEGEAKRDDANYCYVSAWEYAGEGQRPIMHKEALNFEFVHLAERSYK